MYLIITKKQGTSQYENVNVLWLCRCTHLGVGPEAVGNRAVPPFSSHTRHRADGVSQQTQMLHENIIVLVFRASLLLLPGKDGPKASRSAVWQRGESAPGCVACARAVSACTAVPWHSLSPHLQWLQLRQVSSCPG
jgi:hypothetical protein